MTDAEALSPAKRALLERALSQRRAAFRRATTIPKREGSGPVPLSYAQQRMWFLQQWEPTAPTFNGARAIRLRGALDEAALRLSFHDVIERQESLRTVIAGDRDPVQVVLESWSFEMPVLRVEAHLLEHTLRELARQPFDLTRDLMLRATLIVLGADDHVLLLRGHHIAADAHSDSILFVELSEFYNARREGRPPRLPALPIQYSDYAVWHREHIQGSTLQDLVSYWAQQLEGAPPVLVLPTDRPRPAMQLHDGRHQPVTLPRPLAEGLVALSREEGVTFFITMLAAFATFLYRLSGEADVVIGSPIANRNNVELQGLIGFFTNTVALRVRLGGSPSFREVIHRARETALGAYAHQELPFDKVVEALRPKRDRSYNPLFQVNFRAQETPRPSLGLNGLQAENLTVDIGFSRFDLALEFQLRADGLGGYIEYNLDLFNPETITSFVQSLEALLEQIVADPDAPILTLRLPHVSTRRASGATIARQRRRSL
jgi:Condensation domain